jgi:hypothetical protein
MYDYSLFFIFKALIVNCLYGCAFMIIHKYII